MKLAPIGVSFSYPSVRGFPEPVWIRNEMTCAFSFCARASGKLKTASDMKVRLYLENDSWANDDCYVEAEFFSAPRVGDYVSADWYSIIDAILKGDKTEYYKDYLTGESCEWYKDPEARKAKKKPTDEQIRKDFLFDGVGLITSVHWFVEDGVAYCRAWVGEM